MCVFCEIIKGNIPSKKIYEDDNVLAILDISQATKGHTLIIPKKHYANMLEIEEKALIDCIKVTKIVTNKINEAYKPLGFNILNNCNEAAGQSVMHFHIHVIPRYSNDDLVINPTNNTDKFNLDEIASKIRG